MPDDLGSSDKLLIPLKDIDVVLSKSHLDAAVGKKRQGRDFLYITQDIPGSKASCSGVAPRRSSSVIDAFWLGFPALLSTEVLGT